MPTENDIVNIIAAFNSSACIDVHGELFVCGDNSYNKLGILNESNISCYKKVNTLKTKILNMYIGKDHTIVMNSSGQAFGMGKNTEGQLGFGHCNTTKYPQPILLLENIKVTLDNAFFT